MSSSEYTLKISVPEGIRWDRDLQKSLHEALPYYVPNFVDANFDAKAVTVHSRKPLVDPSATEDMIAKLMKDLSRSFRDVAEVMLISHQAEGAMAEQDPFPILAERGEVVSTGHGKFVYRGDFNRVFEGLDSVLRAMCVSHGATPETYPSTVMTQSLLESGYLKLHPHLAFLAAPVKASSESLKAVSQIDLADIDSAPDVVQLLGMPDQVLAPTVCYHTFESRRGQPTEASRITALNKCHRHEPVNVKSLSRLTTYWMREIVAFGEDQELQELLDATLDWTIDFLKRLDMSFEVVSANDPFFGTEGAGNRMMQSAFMLKREVKIPVSNGQTIAVASFNHHQGSLCSKFTMSPKEETEKALSSCCVGWGFERLLYAIYSRHGADLAAWPQHVRDALALDGS
jgi:seryl-tRNA synthetase